MKRLVFLCSTVLIAACSQQPLQSQTINLQGTWAITDIIHLQEVADNKPWLKFTGNQVSGNTNCNQLSGSFSVSNNTLTFSPLATTRKLCLGPAMEQERSLLDLFAKPLTLEQDEKNILLKDGKIRVITLIEQF